MSSTILVVDDDDALRAFLQAALETEGFSVVTASNGVEGLAMAETHRPDLVLLDMSMPEMGGVETLRNLRSNPALRGLPVLILTGQTDFASMVDGWKAGANGYLRKPVTRKELVLQIRRLLPASTPAPGT